MTGRRTVTCQYVDSFGSHPYNGYMNVYDATPVIISVIQPQALLSGGQVSVEIYGTNFGPNAGGLAVCRSGSSPCGTSDVAPAITYWSATQVNAILTASATALGPYDIQIASMGARGTGFLQRPNGGSSSQSNRKPIAVSQPAMLTLSRQTLTQITATGTPEGGHYDEEVLTLDGSNTTTIVGNADIRFLDQRS